MPSTLVAVVYGTVTGTHHRLIEADTDAEIQVSLNNVQPGESAITFLRSELPSDGQGGIIFNRTTVIPLAATKGVTIINPMNAAVVPGATALSAIGQKVSNIIPIDPGFHTLPGAQLIVSDVASVGDTWSGAVFVKPVPTTLGGSTGVAGLG